MVRTRSFDTELTPVEATGCIMKQRHQPKPSATSEEHKNSHNACGRYKDMSRHEREKGSVRRRERKHTMHFTVLKSCHCTNLKRDVEGKVNSPAKRKHHWHNGDQFKQAVYISHKRDTFSQPSVPLEDFIRYPTKVWNHLEILVQDNKRIYWDKTTQHGIMGRSPALICEI